MDARVKQQQQMTGSMSDVGMPKGGMLNGAGLGAMLNGPSAVIMISTFFFSRRLSDY